MRKALLRHLSLILDGFAGKHAREDVKLGDDLAAHVAKLEMSLGLEWRLQHSLLMAIPAMTQVDLLILTRDARVQHNCIVLQYLVQHNIARHHALLIRTPNWPPIVSLRYSCKPKLGAESEQKTEDWTLVTPVLPCR